MPVSRISTSTIGRRLRERREALGWSLERVGVEIGLDESSARARISRYELGVHQPAEEIARITVNLIRDVTSGVPGRHVLLRGQWQPGGSVIAL